MTFKKGDPVFIKQGDGEVPAIFQEYHGPASNPSSAWVLIDGERKQVYVKDVLAPKKPGFEIRDLAFIIDEHREAVQGEVIALGIGHKGKRFYQMRFDPSAGHGVGWYSEDEVFIESAPKQPLKISQHAIKAASQTTTTWG
jgi:hypothetical protein